jgi:hypothetical protein
MSRRVAPNHATFDACGHPTTSSLFKAKGISTPGTRAVWNSSCAGNVEQERGKEHKMSSPPYF